MNAYAQKEQKASSEKDKTGIPAQMKAKFERSSGFSFDDVRVHYNSEKPAQLHAHAYTQGSEVFVAPGQEKHLPHELGHVVQQKSSEVKPTGEVGGMPLNDDEAMEDGADKLAEEAESSGDSDEVPLQAKAKDGGVVQRKQEASQGSYNYFAGGVAGVSSAVSAVAGSIGAIGGLISFWYSKSADRKHRYIDEIEKYADATCDASEEYIAQRELAGNAASVNQAAVAQAPDDQVAVAQAPDDQAAVGQAPDDQAGADHAPDDQAAVEPAGAEHAQADQPPAVSDADKAKAGAEMLKLRAKAERNYNAAIEKTIAMNKFKETPQNPPQPDQAPPNQQAPEQSEAEKIRNGDFSPIKDNNVKSALKRAKEAVEKCREPNAGGEGH